MVEPETAGLGRFLDKWLETSVKPRGRSKDSGRLRKASEAIRQFLEAANNDRRDDVRRRRDDLTLQRAYDTLRRRNQALALSSSVQGPTDGLQQLSRRSWLLDETLPHFQGKVPAGDIRAVAAGEHNPHLGVAFQ